MNGDTNGNLGQLPEEMFTIIKASQQALGPRLGKFALPGRKLMETPHYLGNTSRGAVPHITQDTFRRDTHISGVYYALEDCEHDLFPAFVMRKADAYSVM
jgi:queuine tRNA-ribosyltransferase subunit QTRTD1